MNTTGNLAGMTSECGHLGLVSANPCSSMVIAGVARAGLWASENGGKSWSKLGSGAGSAEITNRISAVVYDPDHPGTFWESGIYNGGGVYKTTDNGKTFAQLGDPAELPDGRIVVIGKDHLLISADHGATWKPIGEPLPYAGGGYDGARGPAYSVRTKTFFIWRWDCGMRVLADAIMSAGFDYTKE